MKLLIRSAVVALVVVLMCAGSAAAASTTQSGDNLRTGWYPNAGISPEIVNGGTFGQLWSADVDGQVYAQPLVAGSGSSATVIAATETDHVYGLDPADGSQRWQTTLGTPWNPGTIGCADIQPSIGTTSTPVLDPSTNTVYVSFKSVVNGSPVWQLAALDIATGQERPNFPVTLGGSADNNPAMRFAATTQQQRPGLLLLNGVIYLGFGSHCDVSPWQGWVMGVSTTTGQVTARWVDTTGNGAGIWQSGTGLMSDGPGTILLTTGNGGAPRTPAPGSTPETSYGDSVVRLDVQPDGTLEPGDFFAPFDAIQLDNTDADFASGGIVGLPDQYFGTPSIPHLAVVDGKEGYVYLLNRDDLGGYQQGTGGGDDVVQRLGPFSGVWGRPGIWPGDGGYVYITPAGDKLNVYKYGVTAGGQPALSSDGSTSDAFGWGSGSPVITSDGTTSGSALVWNIWAADRTGSGGELRAYNPIPVDGQLQLDGEWSIGNASNYSTPGFGDDGRLYVGTRDGKVLAFGSPVTQPLTAPALSFPATVDGSTSQQTLQITADEAVDITSISSSTSEFAVDSSSLPASLHPGQTLSVPVTFAPTDTDTGPVGGQITIQTDAGAITVPVSAVARSSGPLLVAGQPRLALGGAAVGQQLSGSVTFTNAGNTPLTITGETLPQAPFSVPDAPAIGDRIAAGQTVTVTVDFSPTSAGTFADTIELVPDQGPSAEIDISATAAAPGSLQFSPSGLDFGSVAVGATATKSFSITNAGGTTVTIERSKPPFGGAFRATTALQEGSTIAPGQTVTETVQFSPTTVGAQSSDWSINGDDSTGVHDLPFTGTGTPTGTGSTSEGQTTTPTTATSSSSPKPPSSARKLPHAPRLSRSQVEVGAVGGVRISYTAVTAATATFSVQRRRAGHLDRRRCVAVTAAQRRGPRCTRWVTAATLRRRDRVGAVSLPITAIVPARRRLTPGVYRIRSVLDDSGGHPHTFIVTLRVLAPRRRTHRVAIRTTGEAALEDLF